MHNNSTSSTSNSKYQLVWVLSTLGSASLSLLDRSQAALLSVFRSQFSVCLEVNVAKELKETEKTVHWWWCGAAVMCLLFTRITGSRHDRLTLQVRRRNPSIECFLTEEWRGFNSEDLLWDLTAGWVLNQIKACFCWRCIDSRSPERIRSSLQVNVLERGSGEELDLCVREEQMLSVYLLLRFPGASEVKRCWSVAFLSATHLSHISLVSTSLFAGSLQLHLVHSFCI